MADKKFIGRCKPGKYPEQIEMGLTRQDLEFLIENLNDKDWVNVRINKGKDSGKPYCEFIQFNKSDLPF